MRKLPQRAGICLSPAYLKEVVESKPDLGWLEFKPEHFLGQGGAHHQYLEKLIGLYPMAMHCQGLSIASAESTDAHYLDSVKALANRYKPAQISTPLAWCRWQGKFLGTPLPFPFTRESLDQVIINVRNVQNTLGRRILIENVASYIPFSQQEMTEPEFIQELIRNTGCGFLLDVNNLYISSMNQGIDPFRVLARYPLAAIQEIHISGQDFVPLDDNDILLLENTHSSPKKPVFQLFRESLLALPRPVGTLLEWDEQQPDIELLQEELRLIDAQINTAIIRLERVGA